MRLHTDTLTEQDLYNAIRTAGVTFDVYAPTRHGSRARHHAFEVKLLGTSSYRPNAGTRGGYNGDDYAATWDEWGIFLGVLFERDPRMIAGGPNGYVGAADYHWQTGFRFARHGLTTADGSPVVLTPEQQHKRHRWDHRRDASVTGLYYVSECRCGAIVRRRASGVTRADLGLDVPARQDATV